MIICPDTEIELLADGVYDWTPQRAGEAWRRAYQKFGRALRTSGLGHTTVIVMVGLPGSGKSTFATWYDSPSEIIFDATNVDPMRRQPLVNIAAGAGFKTAAIYVECTATAAIARQEARGRKAVSSDIIHRMAKRLRSPGYDEGFGAIINATAIEPHPNDHREWIKISALDRDFWYMEN